VARNRTWRAVLLALAALMLGVVLGLGPVDTVVLAAAGYVVGLLLFVLDRPRR
jgi:hypothetical protein